MSRPIFEKEFQGSVSGRGPELSRVLWSNATLLGFEFQCPMDGVRRFLKLLQVEAVQHASEEVHGGIAYSAESRAHIFDLGKSDWFHTFSPGHLEDCSHLQIQFYDEIFDVICREVHVGRGSLKSNCCQGPESIHVADPTTGEVVIRRLSLDGGSPVIRLRNNDNLVHEVAASSETHSIRILSGTYLVSASDGQMMSNYLEVHLAPGELITIECDIEAMKRSILHPFPRHQYVLRIAGQ